MVFVLFAAPSEPLELRCNTMTDDSILLVWKKPFESNGIIRYYLITTFEKVANLQVGKPINETFRANTLQVMKIVSDLKPFREYVFYVKAVTVTPGKPTICLARTKAGGKFNKSMIYDKQGNYRDIDRKVFRDLPKRFKTVSILDNFHSALSSAPSEPTNVQAALTELSITIKWDPPLEKNGILEMYKVSLLFP